MKIRLFLALPLVLAAASSARANLLINGSLETTAKLNSKGRVLVTSSSPSSVLPGWTLTQGTIDILPSSYWQPSAGKYSVDIIGTPGLGGISQTVSGLTIGADYLLTFDFAANPDALEKGSTKILQIEAVGGSLLATQTYQRTAAGASTGNMKYTQQTFQFTADATSVTLTLSALAPLNLPASKTSTTAIAGPVVDNLDLEAVGGSSPATPEPASLGLLSSGALLLLRRRRK